MEQNRNMGNSDHMYLELLKLEKNFACHHYQEKGKRILSFAKEESLS